MEIFGAVCLTIVAFWIAFKFVFMVLFAVAFSGWKNNILPAILCFSIAAVVLAGWWFLVGTKINVGFG